MIVFSWSWYFRGRGRNGDRPCGFLRSFLPSPVVSNFYPLDSEMTKFMTHLERKRCNLLQDKEFHDDVMDHDDVMNHDRDIINHD